VAADESIESSQSSSFGEALAGFAS